MDYFLNKYNDIICNPKNSKYFIIIYNYAIINFNYAIITFIAYYAKNKIQFHFFHKIVSGAGFKIIFCSNQFFFLKYFHNF